MYLLPVANTYNLLKNNTIFEFVEIRYYLTKTSSVEFWRWGYHPSPRSWDRRDQQGQFCLLQSRAEASWCSGKEHLYRNENVKLCLSWLSYCQSKHALICITEILYLAQHSLIVLSLFKNVLIHRRPVQGGRGWRRRVSKRQERRECWGDKPASSLHLPRYKIIPLQLLRLMKGLSN